MAHNYENIVTEWYNKLKPDFISYISSKFSALTYFDAENLYQDAFLAVYKNIQDGRVKNETSWRAYIFKIGMNLANKQLRGVNRHVSIDEGSEDMEGNFFSQTAQRVEEKYQELLEMDNDLVNNTEAQSLLGNEINRSPEKCRDILILFYYEGFSMDQIAERTGYSNAKTVKAKKFQCMKDLKNRVQSAFESYGLI